MQKRYILLMLLCVIIAFGLGTKFNKTEQTSPVNHSDVIAVVNNDQKQQYLGEELKFGDNVLNQISNLDTQFQYTLTGMAEAAQGLESGKYAGVIEIPSNFTKAILSINSSSPEKTSVTYSIAEDVTDKKRSQLELEINQVLNTFRDNVSYMFIYAIFDQLHTSQEGITVVAENSKSVYQFLTELSEIDIVGNHDYELEPNNSDSFEQIDISEQLSQFNQTVEKYQTEVTSVITVFENKNQQYNKLVKFVMEDLVYNDEQLNERIANVEDTLQTLVNDNQQYTTEDFSITKVTGNIKRIVIDYLTQLITVNDTVKTNSLVAQQLEKLASSVNELNNNQQYHGIVNWLTYRIAYYSELKVIEDSCLNLPTNDQTVVGDCYEEYRTAYNGTYTDYQAILEQLAKEQDYYTSMTYYLEHMSALSTAEDPSAATVDISVPVNQQSQQAKQQPVTDQPQINLTDYSQLSTSHNYIGISLSNIDELDQFKLDITNTTNIDQVELITSSEETEVTSDSITFKNLSGSDIQVLIDLTKNNENRPITFTLKDANQKYQLETAKKTSLTYDATVLDDQSVVSIDFQYTVENPDNLVEVNLCSTEKDCDLSSIELTDDSNTVELTDSGFLIRPVNHQSGEIIEFNLLIPNNFTSRINLQPLAIDNELYQALIITEQTTVDSSLQVSDDQYKIDPSATGEEDKYITIDDDIDQNRQLEQGEQIGVKYELVTTGQTSQQLKQISFDYSFSSQVIEPSISPEFFVTVDNNIVPATATFADDHLTIDFNSPVVIGNLTDDGTYQSEVSLYINLQLIANLGQPIVELNVNNPSLILNDNLITTDETTNRNIEFAAGKPKFNSLVYTVDGSSCQTSEIDSCQFEAGEKITRTITISNLDNSVAGGLTVSNLFAEELDASEIVNPFEIDSTQITMTSGEELSAEQVEYYQSSIESAIESGQQFSVPANMESLEIESSITFDQYLTEQQTITDTLSFSQYGTELAKSEIDLNIIPIQLKVSITDTVQMVEDAVITPGETVDFTIEVKNASSRGTSSDNNIALEIDPEGQVVTSVELLAVEDAEWNVINSDLVKVSGNTLNVNVDLAPNELIRIKLRVKFNDLSTTSSPTVTFKFSSFRDEYVTIDEESCQTDITCDSETIGLSTADYLTLARNQASNGDVLGSSNYQQSLGLSENINEQISIFEQVFGKLRDNFTQFTENIANLKQFTNRSNKQLQQMIDQIIEFGIGIESADDPEPTADYDYCSNNQEVSCQLFKLYNKIYKNELKAKDYFANLLQIVDPTVDETLGIKDDSEEPINIGADFNGYGECDLSGNSNEETECIRPEPGINHRIEAQNVKRENLETAINLILDNELDEINEEPYKQQLEVIDQLTSTEISQVEDTNNQLFAEKIDIYNQNYDSVMNYVQAIAEDQTYIEAISKFKDAEDLRQADSKVILDFIYTLMPNTYLNGIPNKLVYSALVAPFEANEVSPTGNFSQVITNFNYRVFFIFIISLGVLIIILLAIYLFVNRGV